MIKIIIFILCALFAAIILKSFKSGVSVVIGIIACTAVLLIGVSYITPTVEFVKSLSDRVELNNGYLEIILKCTAICFLSDFASRLCRDSGEGTLAYAAEFICRCSVISLTLPVYIDVFNWIIKLWENI